MRIKNTELLQNDFDNLNVETIIYKKKEEYVSKMYFDKFRYYIFKRYNIKKLEYNNDYPEVILIKRNDRTILIDDEYLQKLNKNITTGKERREIKDVNKVELYLQINLNLYILRIYLLKNKLNILNAKVIICAHGAVMSNMFFCKSGTRIIEVTCGCRWPFFNRISEILELNHIKCHKNNFDAILKYIE